MVENLVFLFKDDDFKEFLAKEDFRKNTLLICKNNNTKESLSKNGYNVRTISEYKLSQDQITKPIRWIKSWSNEKILGDLGIKELFSYEGISLFWYLESRFFHKRIHSLIILIEQLKNIVSKENPNKLWIIGDFDSIHILKSLHSNVYAEEIPKYTKSNISEKSYSGFLLWKLIILKFFRGIIIPKKIKNMINPIIFVTEIGSWRLEYDSSIKKYQYRDVFFHNIIIKLKEMGEPIEIIDFENNPNRLLKSYFINRNRISSLGISIEPWEKFLTFKSILKCRISYKKNKEMWKFLKNTESFQRSLLIDNISIYELLVNDFEELFNSFKTIASVAMIEASKKIIKKKRPSKVIMHDEYGAIQISLLYAAKNEHIPTLSLQHGLIYDDAFAYAHNIEDFNNQKSELNFVIPDKMCVWSENSKNALINSAKFHPDSIIVTGDPKTDTLVKMIDHFNRKKFLQEFNIPADKTIILFATENLPNRKERELVAETVFRTVTKIDGLFLVIKIHPNEFDSTLYQKIIDELNFKSYLILKEVNLYEIIHSSDLVIISYSTVGLEAMRMSKPVIALNLMGLHEESIIIKNNLAIEVKNENDLISSIIECKKSQNKRRIDEAKIFAEQELGKITGNATEKIIKEILELKNKKHEI